MQPWVPSYPYPYLDFAAGGVVGGRYNAKAERRSTNRPKSIALAKYPHYERERENMPAEIEIEYVRDIVSRTRARRAEIKLDPKIQIVGSLYAALPVIDKVGSHSAVIQKLAGLNLTPRAERAPESAPIRISTPEYDLDLDVPQTQMAEQRKRLEKEREQLEKNIANSSRQLGDETFLNRAPAHVIESIKTKLVDYEAQLQKVRKALNGFSS